MLAATQVESRHALSLVFVCPGCGRPWAQIVVEEASFLPERRPCARCEWAEMPPGSIAEFLGAEWTGPMTRHAALEELPLDVLRYEMNVHLMYREKELANGQDSI